MNFQLRNSCEYVRRPSGDNKCCMALLKDTQQLLMTLSAREGGSIHLMLLSLAVTAEGRCSCQFFFAWCMVHRCAFLLGPSLLPLSLQLSPIYFARSYVVRTSGWGGTDPLECEDTVAESCVFECAIVMKRTEPAVTNTNTTCRNGSGKTGGHQSDCCSRIMAA